MLGDTNHTIPFLSKSNALKTSSSLTALISASILGRRLTIEGTSNCNTKILGITHKLKYYKNYTNLYILCFVKLYSFEYYIFLVIFSSDTCLNLNMLGDAFTVSDCVCYCMVLFLTFLYFNMYIIEYT